MPNIQSAVKRMRSDAKKRERNKTAVSELHGLDRKLVMLSNDPEKAREVAKTAISRYDRAASRGIIHPNRAARKKARIAHFLAKITSKKQS